MKSFIFFIAGILFSITPVVAKAGAASNYYEPAEEILDNLFKKSGYPIERRPELEISDKAERVAAYYPSTNKIIFEKKAIDVCRSLGKDSLSAMAFLLGHELIHAFQEEVKEHSGATNFLSYDRQYSGAIRVEKTADIQGAFSAYLAGFQVLPVLPELFDRLYESYDLIGVTLRGYPSLAERKATGEEVRKIVVNLIDIYENASYLIALGEYDLAKDCYEYILRYYQSPEVYNNLGVMNVFRALRLRYPLTDKYIHPFRLDGVAVLPLPRPSRGSFERKLRFQLLKKAQKYFEKALAIDSRYNLAKVNLMSVYNLTGQTDKTILYYSNRFKSGRPPGADMALGLAYLIKNENRSNGLNFLQKCMKSEDVVLRSQAKFNYDQALSKKSLKQKDAMIRLPNFVRELVTGISLGNLLTRELVYLSEDTDTYFSKSGTGVTTVFSFEKPADATNSFKRIRIRQPKSLLTGLEDFDLRKLFYKNMLPLHDGFMFIDPGKKFLLKANGKGELTEVIRVFRH